MIETGILFGEIHSFRDLNLILSKVSIGPAIPKENYVDIPGGDGSIDLTEAQGEVHYFDRDCTFEFTVFPQDELSFEDRQTVVSNALNGKRFNIFLDKDPNFYYSGRCAVNEYLQDRNLKKITVTAKVKPYKWHRHQTSVTVNLTAGEQIVSLANGRKTVTPVVSCTGRTWIACNGTEHELDAGEYRYLGIQLFEGANTLTVWGTGTVTFTYQEGEL